jgi:phosphoribosylcarboxyaminoimidazole (NCAIR) mutase
MGHFSFFFFFFLFLIYRARHSLVVADYSGARVGIIMGSDSDLPCMKDAAEILDSFGVPYELTVVSAHRTPNRMYSYAQSAVERGLQVIIAGAGGAAHLPGKIYRAIYVDIMFNLRCC